jgi:hypothetical protein
MLPSNVKAWELNISARGKRRLLLGKMLVVLYNNALPQCTSVALDNNGRICRVGNILVA